MKIAHGNLVTLHLDTYSQEGEQLGSTREEEGEPILVLIGAGDLPLALEKALVGKQAGDKLELALACEDAYGPQNPESIIAIPRAELPPDVDVEPGDYLPLLIEPDEEDGDLEEEEIEVPVVAVEDDAVIVDLNHPMAGLDLRFEVEVLDVQPAPAE